MSAAPRSAEARGGWRGIVRAFGQPSAATLAAFGFGCGLPFLLVGYTMSTWLRDVGFELGLIGFISYVSLLYTFKFAWAPWLDRLAPPLFASLGRRRGWLMCALALLALALAGIAATDPVVHPYLFVVLAAVACLAGATQDAAVDAYRIEIAPIEHQAALAATYTLGYRLGLMSGGAGAFYLADLASWQVAYLVMAAAVVIPAVAVLLAREPARSQAGLAHARLIDIALPPFREFFSRVGWVLAALVLVFVGLYKFPDQMLGVIAGPFYLDTGHSLSQIATVSKLYGIWIGIAGAFVGGVLVSAIGLRTSLIVATIAVGVSNLLFIVMSLHPGETWPFVLTITGDNLSQGMAGPILVTFMSRLVNRDHAATQYALLSSLANMPGKLVGGLSGLMAQSWGYTGFFMFSTISVLPALLLLLWLWPRLPVKATSETLDRV